MSVNPRARRFPAILVLLALIYLPLFVVLSRADYNPLVNDYRPYARTELGQWPSLLLAQLNPLHPSEWIYRPLPEGVEWAFSELFRGHPGAWHGAILAFRVLTVAFVWMLAGRLTASAATRAAVTCFAALFPAFPEAQLIYAETQILPLLAAVLLGLARLDAAEEPRPAPAAMTASAFVLLTLCKEILAPMSAVLWVALVVALRPWRSRTGLLASGLTGVALLLQGLRCFRTATAPYARQGETVDQAARALGNLDWFVDRVLLRTTNLALTSLVLTALIALGAVATLRYALPARWRGNLPALAALGSLGAVLVVHLPSPYRALRYVYPAAVLLVPLLARGLDAVGARWPRVRTGMAAFLVAVLTAFGAPVLWSQALAVRHSNDSDWALLEFLARQRAKGADIALSPRLGEERTAAIRQELAGSWSIPGFTAPAGDGRILEFAAEPPEAGPGRNLAIVLRRELLDPSTAALGEERQIPPQVSFSPLGRFLLAFEPAARRLNSAFAYPQDAGSTRFPGHGWRVLVQRAPPRRGLDTSAP